MSVKKLRVAIWYAAACYILPCQRFLGPRSGGGVGGLVCAVALSRYHDIQVDVYEAASAFTEVGAGIGVWPRTWKILAALGLTDDLAKIAIVPPSEQPRTSLFACDSPSFPMMYRLGVAFNFRKGDQPEGINFYTLSTPGAFRARL